MSLPAPPVLMDKHHIRHLQVCSIHCQFSAVPGPTVPWTLSPVCLSPKVIQSYSTFVDRFSKSVHFVVLPKLPSSREIADLLVNNVFLHHIYRYFFLVHISGMEGILLGIGGHHSGYHPQTNGQMERANQDLEPAS